MNECHRHVLARPQDHRGTRVGRRSRRDLVDRAAALFRRELSREADVVCSAPGRLNLVGEHTDYNDGLALAIALPHRAVVAAAARDDGRLTVTSVNLRGEVRRSGAFPISEIAVGGVPDWAVDACAVAGVLREHGMAAGADLVLAGDVPARAGLASDRAAGCAVALALLELAGATQLSGIVAELVRRAANEFGGVPAGVLDQTASLDCIRDHALFLDARSGTAEQIPFTLAGRGLSLVVIDVRTRGHVHHSSSRAARRVECARAAAVLGVPTLRDIGMGDLSDALRLLPAELHGVVRHVVTENDRVVMAGTVLRTGCVADLGPLLTTSHASLRDDHRVSGAALDLAAGCAVTAGAIGARLTGSGFDGSVLALVPSHLLQDLDDALTCAFAGRGLSRPRLFTVTPSDGARRDR
ncbi:galactokinase [Saccharothrix hoggarensis]|uniref:Galactokinase n=1 Tax=Saccharothrix hoggarensis TaxID=913853 RepID=A0ABW3QHS5_9PSEU